MHCLCTVQISPYPIPWYIHLHASLYLYFSLWNVVNKQWTTLSCTLFNSYRTNRTFYRIQHYKTPEANSAMLFTNGLHKTPVSYQNFNYIWTEYSYETQMSIKTDFWCTDTKKWNNNENILFPSNNFRKEIQKY